MFTWLDGDPPPPPLSTDEPFRLVAATDDPTRVVVWISGELDILTAEPLADGLRTQLDAMTSGTDLIVDLSDVRFVGARGLSVLVFAATQARSRGCEFCIIGCSPPVMRIIDVTGVRSVLAATAA